MTLSILYRQFIVTEVRPGVVDKFTIDLFRNIIIWFYLSLYVFVLQLNLHSGVAWAGAEGAGAPSPPKLGDWPSHTVDKKSLLLTI